MIAIVTLNPVKIQIFKVNLLGIHAFSITNENDYSQLPITEINQSVNFLGDVLMS